MLHVHTPSVNRLSHRICQAHGLQHDLYPVPSLTEVEGRQPKAVGRVERVAWFCERISHGIDNKIWRRKGISYHLDAWNGDPPPPLR